MSASALTVIGNEFLDIIDIINYDGKYQRKIRSGGIMNIPQGQKRILRTGIANILITKHGTESACEFGYHLRDNEQHAYNEEYDWVHLAYANLVDIDFTKVKAKTKSCDLTKHWFQVPTELIMKNVACCDYVFLSLSDDHKSLKNYLLKEAFAFRGWIIEHSEQGSVALQRKNKTPHDSSPLTPSVWDEPSCLWENLSHYCHPRETFLYTVGAGDRFAGYFIEHRMKNFSIKECQEYAHTEVLKWLKEINANI